MSRGRRHLTKRQYETKQKRKSNSRHSETSDNRVICLKTGRAKYLYPTLKKALLACKYSEDPQRPYYCKQCMGFHTTSETKEEYYDKLEHQLRTTVEKTEKQFKLR
ncbi:MAG: hypothetical protein IJ122_06085 [Methanobrevibacter sp.]|nr:hypothetical protein [Methanobrevibacter sp.]